MTFPHSTPTAAGKKRRVTGRLLTSIALIGLATAGAFLAYDPVAEARQTSRIEAAPEIDGTGTRDLEANTTYALYDTGGSGGTCTITAPDGSTFEPTIGLRQSVAADGQQWDAEGTFTPTTTGTYAFDCADETGPQTAKVFEGSDLDPIATLVRVVQGVAIGVSSLLTLLAGLAFVMAGKNAHNRQRAVDLRHAPGRQNVDRSATVDQEGLMAPASPPPSTYTPGAGLRRAGGVVVVVALVGLVLGILAVFNQPWMTAWQDSKVASAPIVDDGEGIALEADTRYTVYTRGGLCEPVPPSGEERYNETIRASVPPSTDDAGTWDPTVTFVTEEAGTYVFECRSKDDNPVQARVFPSGMFEAVAGLFLSAIGVVAIVVFLIIGGIGGLLMLVGTHQRQRALLDGSTIGTVAE